MPSTKLPQELVELIFSYICTARNPPFLSDAVSLTSAFDFASCSKRHLDCLIPLLSHISTLPERFREDPLAHKPREGILVDTENATNASHLASLLRLSYPVLTTLSLAVSPRECTWVDALSPSPPLLRVLSLREIKPEYPLVPLLKLVGPQLSDLEIVGTTGVPLSQSQITGIGRHAHQVKYLALRLSIFQFDWRPLWYGVGETLNHLSIGATRFWIMDSDEDLLLSLISDHCPHISKLHFYHVGPSLGPSLSDLCTRYGTQLEDLTLEQCQVHRPDLFKIANHCPNVTVHSIHGSSLFSHAYNTDIIDVLAPKLGSLSYRTQLSHDDSLFDLRRCRNLQRLRLDCASTVSKEALQGIVQAVQKSLKELSVGFLVGCDDAELVTDMLNWLSQGTPNLEILRISGPVFAMQALEKVLRVTRVTQLAVTFGLHTRENTGNVDAILDLLAVVAATVKRCPGFECVVVKDRRIGEERDRGERADGEGDEWKERVRRACLCLRGKVGRVSVCGKEFV